MVKILAIISEPFANGGEETFIINVIKNIGENFIIDLYAPFGFNNDNYRSIIESYGGKVIVENPPLKPNNIRINIVIPLLKKLCYEYYDVVHIHSSNISPLAFAAFSGRVPETQLHLAGY